MANWLRKLNLKDVWNREESGKTLQELSGIIADRLEKIKPFSAQLESIDDRKMVVVEYERLELVDTFRDMAKDEFLTVREFDHTMDALYDWADTTVGEGSSFSNTPKVCWVATSF